MEQKEKKNQSRILYFDILNIAACLAVIFLHHNGIVHSFKDTLAWRESLIVECAFYWAVPIFLMLSGANLLNYRSKYDTKTFLKKRFIRTVIPWLFWSIVMIFWKAYTGDFVFENHSFSYLMDLILNYKIETKYWFFGALFACYLAMPVFSLLCNNRKILWYVAGVNFILLSCLPALKVWTGWHWDLDVPIAGSLIIYVLLGYLLATQTFNKKQRWMIYIGGLTGFMFRYIYTYVLSVKNGTTDVSIKGYRMFHAVLLAVAVFELAKNIRWEKYLPDVVIRKLPLISSYSFGVYLIHSIVMYYEQNILHIAKEGYLWRIAFVPCTYCVSVIIVYLLKKIPFVGKYICG